MRTLILISFLSFLFPFWVLAQQRLVQGAILDYGDGKRIAGAIVQNLNSKEIIQSNTMGVFSINAQEGDSLRVTKSDYNEGVTVVHGAADIIFRLQPSFQLREVNVYGQSKKDQLDDVMNDFRKKGNYFNGKPPVLAYVASPISALYGLFGKTPKNARRFQNYMNAELEQSVIDRKFTVATVQTSTGLSGEDLTNFMDIYRPSFHQAEHWNDYDIQAYVKKCFAQFEADGRPEAQKLPKIEIPKQEK